MTIVRLIVIAFLLIIHLVCSALPKGSPPPMPMTFVGDYWNCVLPLRISVKGTSSGHVDSSIGARVVQNFKLNDAAKVLMVRNVVIEPGVARITNGDFEHNDLNLSVGTEVYVLAEWEFLYFHAWEDGHEVEGGMPIGDESFFTLIRAPKIERWIFMQQMRPPKVKSWVKYTEALRDDHAIRSCAPIPFH